MERESDRDQVLLLECNLDDMTGEALGYALEQALAAGALDAWFTPIYMKKNRPAQIFSILCLPEDRQALCELLLRDTTTLGVRWQALQREVAQRRNDQVDTPWGIVRRKIKMLHEQIVSIKPEYEDCARLAREHGIPLARIWEAARAAQISETQ